ncbi:MAG TPA: hypothetical protein VNJ53_03705 [Gaiellaceae bacterium]|nr:hypothetical protein [Gaiellaceae bacterium]
MAALAGLIVAHGGLAGALVEASLAVAVVGFLVAVWLRERRRGRRRRGPARLRDDGSA